MKDRLQRNKFNRGISAEGYSGKDKRMNVTERTTAVGVFTERIDAERAIEELVKAGFSNEHVGFITRGKASLASPTGTETDTGVIDTLPVEIQHTIPPVIIPTTTPGPAPAVTDTAAHDNITGYSRTEATAAGAAGGGVLGGILGAAASLLIPGFGPAIAGGVLAAILGGVVIGAVAGGFVGALTQMGIPEEEAHYYQDELNAGRAIVTVKAGGRYLEALNILRYNGAYDATTRYIEGDNASPSTNANGHDATEAVANTEDYATHIRQGEYSFDDPEDNDLTEKQPVVKWNRDTNPT
jgi:hypothetical protein